MLPAGKVSRGSKKVGSVQGTQPRGSRGQGRRGRGKGGQGPSQEQETHLLYIEVKMVFISFSVASNSMVCFLPLIVFSSFECFETYFAVHVNNNHSFPKA